MPFSQGKTGFSMKNKERKERSQKKKKKTKKQKNKKYSKMSFSVISENFLLFWVGVQNFPFLTTWPQKARTLKHNKNRGFQAPFLENRCASRNGHFWTKKTKIHKFQLSFLFVPVFFSFNNRKHKNC